MPEANRTNPNAAPIPRAIPFRELSLGMGGSRDHGPVQEDSLMKTTLVAAFALVALTLAACGGSKPAATDAGDAAGDAAASAAATAAPDAMPTDAPAAMDSAAPAAE